MRFSGRNYQSPKKVDGYPDVFRNECDYDDRVSSGTVAGTYQQ